MPLFFYKDVPPTGQGFVCDISFYRDVTPTGL